MRQELYPHIDGNGRTLAGKLDALGFIALDDAQRDFPKWRADGERVAVEGHGLQLLFCLRYLLGRELCRHFLLHGGVFEFLAQSFKVTQVGIARIKRINGLAYVFNVAFKFCHGLIAFCFQ